MPNTIQAVAKYLRISPMKVRDTIRFIRGMKAEDAMFYLSSVPRKSARLIRKTLKSAIANAENCQGLSASKLFISEAVANQGPVIKRFMPAARGSAHPIQKGTTHILIRLSSKN